MEQIEKIDLNFLSSAIKWLNEHKCGCYFKKVAETEGGTGLYIVIGWGDGYEKAEPNTPNADDTYRICGKIAYQHSDNIMQCDYDWDWYMPYNKETGDVDDTDGMVEARQFDVDWLNKNAKRVWNEWKDKLDSLG
jgi:hypothetical protein